MTNEQNQTKERKTIVSVDLVGYNLIAESAEEGLGPEVVKKLNEQIQQFISSALAALQLARHDHFASDTGDGGILIFDSSDDAFLFATHIIKQTQEHNRTRHRGISKRIFRIGAASGEIVIERKTGAFEIAGIAIARAVRLQAKAPPGGLFVDKQTFYTLNPDHQKELGSFQTVTGKRAEKFDAYLREPYPGAENDAAFFRQDAEEEQMPTPEASKSKFDRAQLLRDINRLHPNTYSQLIFLLEIPIEERPSNVLPLATKREQVVEWAETNGKLPELLQVIQELSGSQRPQ